MKNWAEIRNLYLSATGQINSAAEESFTHLTEGYRILCGRLNVQDLDVRELVVTVAGQDWVSLPTDVFHIITVWDRTNAQKLTAEAEGMRGRSRYITPVSSTSPAGGPPSGKPLYYVPSAGRLYLRNTPDAAYELEILSRQRPPAITESDLSDRPLTPEQYDMGIVWAATINCLSVHPDSNTAADGQPLPSAMLTQSLEGLFQTLDLPKDRERFDQAGRVYPAGIIMRW